MFYLVSRKATRYVANRVGDANGFSAGLAMKCTNAEASTDDERLSRERVPGWLIDAGLAEESGPPRNEIAADGV
jgi:hypothetical protein